MLELAMPARAGRLALPDAPGGFLPPPEWPQVVQAIVLSLGFKLVPTLGDGRCLYHAAAIVMDWFDLVSNDDGNFYTHAGADAVAAGALAAMRAHEQMWRHVDEANWNLAVQIASGKGPPRVFPDPDCCVRGVACFIQRWVVVTDCKLGSHQAGFFFFPPGSEPALPCPLSGKSQLYLYVRPDQKQELSYLFNSLSPIVFIRTKTESGAAHYTATLPAPRSTANQLTAQSAAQLPAAEPLAAATGAVGGRPSSPNDLYCDRRAGGSGGLVLPYSSRGSSQLEAR